MWFLNRGYTVRPVSYKSNIWYVHGENIVGAFTPDGIGTDAVLAGKFVATHQCAFQGWTKCPFIMTLNRGVNVNVLSRYLNFLGSNHGKVYCLAFSAGERAPIDRAFSIYEAQNDGPKHAY